MTSHSPSWPWWIKLLWQLVALFIFYSWGHNFVQIMCIDHEQMDFVQEWVAARNWLTGSPVYEEHATCLPKHLPIFDQGLKREEMRVQYNAHPPTSVLLGLPLGLMDYRWALLTWNIFSLGLILLALLLCCRGLELDVPAWLWLPCLALLIIYNPLRQQIAQGQLNGVLLLLITFAWLASRSHRACWTGIWVGLATVIKLTPGFLFLYFVLRGQWWSVAAGLAMIVTATLLTILVLGVEAYQDYLQNVLPSLNTFRTDKANASAWGFWKRLFIGSPAEGILPWMAKPGIAWLGVLLTAGCVIGAIASRTSPQQTPAQADASFAMTVTGMVLLSPISWDHSLILLSLPLLWLMKQMRQDHGINRLSVFLIVFLFFINHKALRVLHEADGVWPMMMGPQFSIGVLSVPFYAVLLMFVLQFQRSGQTAAVQAVRPRPG